jgi:hypothetical protein
MLLQYCVACFALRKSSALLEPVLRSPSNLNPRGASERLAYLMEHTTKRANSRFGGSNLPFRFDRVLRSDE